MLYFIFFWLRDLDMTDNLYRDVDDLKQWLRFAWVRISDPAMTTFERREIRNYMKEAEKALRVGLKRIAEQEAAKREVGRGVVNRQRPDFRILQLDA